MTIQDPATTAAVFAISAERITPWQLAEKYAETWPQIAGNADRAAQFVDNGQIWRRPDAVTLADGATTDLWTVGKSGTENGEKCTHAGGRCTCDEAAITVAQFGRLCSHRIAVFIYKRMQQEAAATLIKLIRYMDQQNPDARIVLEIDRHYRPGAEDRKLIRYITRGPGGEGPRVDDLYKFEIDDHGLAAVMAATGRTLDSAPQKRRSFRYSYILAAMPPAMPGDPIADLRSVDAIAKDAADDRRRRLHAEGRALEAAIKRNARAA